MVLWVIAFPLRLLTREKFVITLQKLRGTRSAARTTSQSAPNSMRVKSSQFIKSCGTLTDPAIETKSIGLHSG